MNLPKPLAVPTGIGPKIDLRMKLKNELEKVNAVVKAYEEQIDEVERQLFQQLEKEGSTRGGGKLATVSVNESTVPQVEDWDAFYKYIARTKYFHLLDRRPSVSGCRELFETKGKIPGVVPFTKKKLNFSTVKG
jgi:hypothetical protein